MLQKSDQATDADGVARVEDAVRATVGKVAEDAESAGVEVEGVDVQVFRSVGEGEGRGERAQQCALARAGAAVDDAVATDVQAEGALSLLGRLVDQADGGDEPFGL